MCGDRNGNINIYSTEKNEPTKRIHEEAYNVNTSCETNIMTKIRKVI